MTRPNMTPQEQARLEGIRRSWQQRRDITERLSHINKKIGVYSGKGGVGKTSVAVNLAVTLAKGGYTVGILDVDIDCPNVVRAMKIYEPPVVGEDKKMDPPERFGVKVMSMAFFQENEDEAIIWRGPMIHNAINQLLQSTEWGSLDYLVIDLPPGTGNESVTTIDLIGEVTGCVIVSTPQEVALLDARKSVTFARDSELPIIGIVENMSGLDCPHCHKHIEVFRKGGGEASAHDMGVPFLGRIPLDPDVVRQSDYGAVSYTHLTLPTNREV